jgi:hypothetical protein
MNDQWRFAARVLLKAAALFIVLNLALALVDPLPTLGRVSLYGGLIPARLRLPYGENAQESYNLSLTNLDAMFHSHELNQPKTPDEFRVLVLGDSSTWGFLQRPDETTSAFLNAGDYVLPDGRELRAYNLGYPEMSLTKDTLLLDYAMQYQPDLIVWLVTLESFALENQFEPFLVRRNPERIQALANVYGLNLQNAVLYTPSLLERTLLGRRRELADWLRLQLYGFMWAATGIDQHYPDSYTLRTSDFDEDIRWHTFTEPMEFTTDDIAFDALDAGIARGGAVPTLIVNEPIFISAGRNSNLRYNFFYPRWAYDRYRHLLAQTAESRGWWMLDLWDALPPDSFTDSPIHYTPNAARQVAAQIAAAIMSPAP